MSDRDEMERDLIEIGPTIEAGILIAKQTTYVGDEKSMRVRMYARALIGKGWTQQGEGSRPCRADNTACSEQSGNAPSPTLRQSVAELREIAKDGDFPTLEELDEIRHGPSPEAEPK